MRHLSRGQGMPAWMTYTVHCTCSFRPNDALIGSFRFSRHVHAQCCWIPSRSSTLLCCIWLRPQPQPDRALEAAQITHDVSLLRDFNEPSVNQPECCASGGWHQAAPIPTGSQLAWDLTAARPGIRSHHYANELCSLKLGSLSMRAVHERMGWCGTELGSVTSLGQQVDEALRVLNSLSISSSSCSSIAAAPACVGGVCSTPSVVLASLCSLPEAPLFLLLPIIHLMKHKLRIKWTCVAFSLHMPACRHVRLYKVPLCRDCIFRTQRRRASADAVSYVLSHPKALPGRLQGAAGPGPCRCKGRCRQVQALVHLCSSLLYHACMASTVLDLHRVHSP